MVGAKYIRALAVLAFWLSASAWAIDGTGLQISVAGDTVGQYGSGGPNGAPDRIDVREAEFLFYAPTDYLFDARASFAAHYENGLLAVEVHELFLETTKLIPRSRLRLGQHFLQFGRLNQVHRHDWPFISTPKIHQTFFDLEGVLDTGIQYGWLMPLPFFLDLTVGITNGWNYGHSHTTGAKPLFPTHYARLATYFDLFMGGGIQTGFNYIGRRDAGDTFVGIFGLDIVAKWREEKHINLLLQSEIWYRTTSPAGGATTNDFGFYFYPEYYLGANFFFGARVDYYTQLDLKNGFGVAESNSYIGIEPTLSWKPSEFTTFRLAYAYRGQNLAGASVNSDQVLLAQWAFILGAHPAHDF